MSRTREEDNEASLADISTKASMDKLETRIIERILARLEQPKGLQGQAKLPQGRSEQQRNRLVTDRFGGSEHGFGKCSSLVITGEHKIREIPMSII